jgi:pimeloyl-ACP methyl ester carboxylesterase/DNA-binding CsgD family transcriptional regulator
MEDMFEHWEHYIESALSQIDLDCAQQVRNMKWPHNDDIERHFAIGLHLLREMEQDADGGQDPFPAHSPSLPALLIDGSGRIVWCNSSATRHFEPIKGQSFTSLPLVGDSENRLSKKIDNLRTSNKPSTTPALLRLQSSQTDKPLFLLASSLKNYDDEQLVQLKQVYFVWEQAVGPILQRSFKLSQSELEVTRLFCEGATIKEISLARNSSASTAKTQLKAIMSKTGAGSQLGLLRLVLTLSALISGQSNSTRDQENFFSCYVEATDGRKIPYHEYGPPDGTPILFVHGMLDGHDLTNKARQLLKQKHIRLIAIERPGFANANPDPGPPATAPERFAHDVKALLDHLKIDRIAVAGHMSGSIFAFGAAAILKERISAVISIAGGVPIVSLKQLSGNPPRQKFFAYVARFMPHLLNFITRAGVQEVRTGGEIGIMHSLHSTCHQDMQLIAEPEISGIISSGYHFATKQGPEAFEIDAHHAVRDWSKYVEASIAPIYLIHGRYDPLVRLSHVDAFARRNPTRAKLIIDETSGQLLFYGNPDFVLSAMAEAARHDQTVGV